MRILDYRKDRAKVERVLRTVGATEMAYQETVVKIIDDVERRGDRAVAHWTKKFDGATLDPRDFRLPKSVLKESWQQLPAEGQKALRLAARRIKAFHKNQRRKSWSIRDATGVLLTNRILPLEAVGLYVPGFAAALPSTVLMAAIPAKIAGVKRIVIATPPPREGVFNAGVFAAAHLTGVDEVYQVGGVQAVAALAFGTKAIPRVDKVVGPGRASTALAKRLLFGRIDIDSIAGPSEILVICDDTANPEFVAADLLSQAEHDPEAVALCVVVGDRALAEAIDQAVRRQTKTAERGEIIRESLRRFGAIIRVGAVKDAVAIANERASEHLELMLRDARKVAKRIHNAGSIFIGQWTPEAIGDYTAGANHVLPTAGTARFFSPLGVDDFVKQNNIVECTRDAFNELAPATVTLAEMEGLYAHANAVKVRQNAS